MTEETTREFITRMRAQLHQLGHGKPARAARVAQAIAAQRPPKPQAFHPEAPRSTGKRVRCIDTGEVFASVKACAAAFGGNQPGLSAAFRMATGAPRVAEWKGKRFVFVGEMEGENNGSHC